MSYYHKLNIQALKAARYLNKIKPDRYYFDKERVYGIVQLIDENARKTYYNGIWSGTPFGYNTYGVPPLFEYESRVKK